MLCEKCQQQLATVFCTVIVHGHGTTHHFCESCAARSFASFPPPIPNADPAGSSSGPDDSIYEALAIGDERFTIDAYRFVIRAVSTAVFMQGPTRGAHVSGANVAEAFRLLALH